jgi:adenylate kinase
MRTLKNSYFIGQSWILDGYPRTMNQAVLLDTFLADHNQSLDLVINLDVPHQVILSRIEERLVLSGFNNL